jgi:uncharacterized protein (TIGR02466 family)
MTDRLNLKAQMMPLFETPVAIAKVEAPEGVIDALRDVILRRRAEDPGVVRSNIGGWHSDTDMLHWGGQAARQVADAAVRLAKRMSHFNETTVEDYDWPVEMWANVSGQGAANLAHTHPGNLWACVFYVDFGGAPTEQTGGEFFLEDPRFPLTAMHTTAFRMKGVDGHAQQHMRDFRLEPGDMVIFPAWLRHGVLPYSGGRERISIAINIDAKLKRVDPLIPFRIV